MSGNRVVRKTADVAAKAGKAIEWDGMATMLVFEEACKEFFGLRRAFEDVNNQLQTKFSQLVKLKEAEKTSLKESERIEKEISKMQEIKKKISTMIVDEYFEKHPELNQKFDDEIRNDYWGY